MDNKKNKEKINIDLEKWSSDLYNQIRDNGATPLDFPSVFVKFPEKPDFMISLNRVNDNLFIICTSKDNEVLATEYYKDPITAKKRLLNKVQTMKGVWHRQEIQEGLA